MLHPATTPSSSPWTSLFLSTLLITSPLLTSVAHAQSTAPPPNRRMGYTIFKDHFYLVGGFLENTGSPSSQFYSLDLSVSWTNDKAPWKRLRESPPLSHLAVVPLSNQDSGGVQGSLLLIGGAEANPGNMFSLYSFEDGSWSSVSAPPPYPKLEGHAAAIQPNTGKVHIFGGYGTVPGNDTQLADLNRLVVYDHVNKAVGPKTTASASDAALAELGAVWLEPRQTFVVFGGTRDVLSPKRKGLGGARLDEYDPSTQQWKTFVTTGSIPPDRAEHCMAANDDGTKVVVFGGADMDNFMADIYILDVASGTWSKGHDAPKSRMRMACGIHNNQLIVVGGSEERRRESMFESTPQIYNLNTGQWTIHYNVDGSDGEPSNVPIGGIIGGVVGLLVVGIIAFLVIRKRRARQYNSFDNGLASGGAGGSTAAAAAGTTTGSLHEYKQDNGYPSATSPGAPHGQDIQLEKLNNEEYGDQYNPHYATAHYGYSSPNMPAYNGGSNPNSYPVSPSINAMSPPAASQQAEYLNYLRQEQPVSSNISQSGGGGGSGSDYDTTPLIPPAAHLSSYSQSTSTEYQQAYFASNPYDGSGGYSPQAGYGYGGASYPTPPGVANAWSPPSAHSNSPQDYTNYVPPKGMGSPDGQGSNSGYVPPPL